MRGGRRVALGEERVRQTAAEKWLGLISLAQCAVRQRRLGVVRVVRWQLVRREGWEAGRGRGEQGRAVNHR